MKRAEIEVGMRVGVRAHVSHPLEEAVVLKMDVHSWQSYYGGSDERVDIVLDGVTYSPPKRMIQSWSKADRDVLIAVVERYRGEPSYRYRSVPLGHIRAPWGEAKAAEDEQRALTARQREAERRADERMAEHRETTKAALRRHGVEGAIGWDYESKRLRLTLEQVDHLIGLLDWAGGE